MSNSLSAFWVVSGRDTGTDVHAGPRPEQGGGQALAPLDTPRQSVTDAGRLRHAYVQIRSKGSPVRESPSPAGGPPARHCGKP